MKAILIFISLTICTVFNSIAQQYKVKYISYKSDVKSEQDGFVLARYKYEKSRIIPINRGEELAITGTNDIIMAQFFKKVPWDRKRKMYFKEMQTRDMGKNIFYMVSVEAMGQFRLLELKIVLWDIVANKPIEDIIIIYEKIKQK